MQNTDRKRPDLLGDWKSVDHCGDYDKGFEQERPCGLGPSKKGSGRTRSSLS